LTDVDLSIRTKRIPQQTRNQTPHDDEIKKPQKKKLDTCENHLFKLKENGKKDVEG